MQATSGDSKQNLTAVFWLSFRLLSKKVRFSSRSFGAGDFIASKTCMRGVNWPDDLPSPCRGSACSLELMTKILTEGNMVFSSWLMALSILKLGEISDLK